MSFKSAFLKAFGFSSADDDDEYDEMENLPSALPVSQQVVRDHASANSAGALADTRRPDDTVVDDPVMKDEDFEFPLAVFDGLLQVFNDAQPDFIQKCLDVEAQRKYLYESMNTSFKEYMAGCRGRMQALADRRNESLLRKIDSESADMRKQLESARKSLAEAKEQSMSAVRQRRAFNERIRDLEQQLETEKAEKEQYSLETKSLLNKLKVAQVQGASDPESAEEIIRLRASVEDLRNKLTQVEGEKQNLERIVAEKQQALETAMTDLEEARAAVKPAVVSFAESKDADMLSEADKTAVTDNVNEVKPKPQRRGRKSRRTMKPASASISVIDDTLDTTEWLVPTPPAGSAKPASSVSDAEFGYHEPQRDEPPVNDAQLSLFD